MFDFTIFTFRNRQTTFWLFLTKMRNLPSKIFMLFLVYRGPRAQKLSYPKNKKCSELVRTYIQQKLIIGIHKSKLIFGVFDSPGPLCTAEKEIKKNILNEKNNKG